jgi:hypothetical protein
VRVGGALFCAVKESSLVPAIKVAIFFHACAKLVVTSCPSRPIQKEIQRNATQAVDIRHSPHQSRKRSHFVPGQRIIIKK